MKTTFKWLVFLGFGIGLGVLLYQDPGYVLLSYAGFIIEMPLLLASIFLFLLLGGLYVILRLTHATLDFPRRLSLWFSRRRQRIAQFKTIQGCLEFVEGNWMRAESILSRAITKQTGLLNYLICARIAEVLGSYERRDHYLRLAHKAYPKEEFAIGITQAELEFARQKYEQSLASVVRLRQIAPCHPAVLKLEQQLCVVLKDWKRLLEVLPLLLKGHLILPAAYEALRVKAYGEWLEAVYVEQRWDAAKTLWRDMPSELKTTSAILKPYAKILIALSKGDELETLLRRALSKHWDAE